MRRCAAVAVLAIGSLAGAEAIRIEGSTTVGPIADAFAEYFKTIQPGLEITVNKTGSGNGAAALIDGRCDIATMSRFMKTEEEFKKAIEKGVVPVAHVVAMDGICVIVHPSNPVKEMTTAQVRDIYLGKIKNWKELSGPDEPIFAIARKEGSGTKDTFNEVIMGSKAAETPGVNDREDDSAGVRTAIVGSDKAIGYLGFNFAKDDSMGVITLDGVKPTNENIKSGNYELSRKLYFYTFGDATPGASAFIEFMTGPEGQKIAEENGYIPMQ
jgi:phosphate transport system substrate-binding protein